MNKGGFGHLYKPIEVWGNGWARPYDDLDRRMGCIPQKDWTAEMYARAVSDQQTYQLSTWRNGHES